MTCLWTAQHVPTDDICRTLQEEEAAQLQAESERAQSAEKDTAARFSAVNSETEFQKTKVRQHVARAKYVSRSGQQP